MSRIRSLLALCLLTLAGISPVAAQSSAVEVHPELEFPRDHDAHPQAGAEIWNLFLLLQTRSGDWIPVRHQWTRMSVRDQIRAEAEARPAVSPWAYKSVYRHWYSLLDAESGGRSAERLAGENLSRGALGCLLYTSPSPRDS